MKSLPIPDNQQIEAMLNFSMYKLTCEYYHNPSEYFSREYITVDRQKIIEYLGKNPKKAEAYFIANKDKTGTHDVEKIWQDGSEYCAGWMDHGKLTSIRRFKNLSEAVAEHVLVCYGMY